MSLFRPLKTKCTCGKRGSKCTCPRHENWTIKFYFRGKQVVRSTGSPDVKVARRMLAELKRAFREGAAAEFVEALRASSSRRSVCTVGEIVKAYEDEAVMVSGDRVNRQRNVSDLYLVIAHARGLWTENAGGIRGRKVGELMPDRSKIDGLSAGVLGKALVRDYFKARQGGRLNVAVAEEGNAAINSTLNKARSIFSARSLSYKLEGLALPDLSGFLKEPFLPVLDAEPEPIKEAEFAAMLEAWAALPADDELRLVNLILRQTGMRSGSVAGLERDWLEDLRSGPVLHVRVRKGRTALYSVPLSDELAAEIRGRPAGPVLLPKGTDAERKELVTARHNAWLKGVIGGAGGRGQGNHRLRDTVATVLLSWLGIEAAKLALGHADERVTLKHYGRLRIDVSEAMKHELRAFEAPRGGKVVRLAAV